MKKTFLSFCINDFPGLQYDLRGCVRDSEYWDRSLWQFDFTSKIFLNSEATPDIFEDQAAKAIYDAKDYDWVVIQFSCHGTQVSDISGDEPDFYDEALVLHGGDSLEKGIYIDDKMKLIFSQKKPLTRLVIISDACHSGDNTRTMNKPRFIRTTERPMGKTRRKAIFRDNDMTWLALSACKSDQTAADAFINGNFNGAFTDQATKAIEKGLTFMEWYKIYAPKTDKKYNQTPQIEGPTEYFRMPIFGGEERKKRCFIHF